MFAKDYRKLAWEKLSGKWGTFALITLIIAAITGILGGLSQYTYGIADIIVFIITGPFALSLAYCALNVSNGQPIKVEDSFVGFKDFVRAFLAFLINSIFIFLWSLLLIIPGIIKALAYDMTFFIMQEDKNISANEARKLSMQMMQGYKWKLFCLYFSFIGWILLSILTLGILLLWVNPYMEVAKAEFYKNIKAEQGIKVGDTSDTEEVVVNTEENN